MKTRHLIIAGLLIVVLLLPLAGGCQAVGEKVKEKAEAMKPEIRSISLDWGKVTDETTEVLATIQTYNPNPFSLPVKKVVADVTMAGVKMVTAETEGLNIEKNAEFPIKISAKIDNAKIPSFWTAHLKQNEKSEMLVDIKVAFDLLGIDFTFPYQVKRPFETDILSYLKQIQPITIEKDFSYEKPSLLPLQPPEQQTLSFKVVIESISGSWADITDKSTKLNLIATIRNYNDYPIPIPKTAYAVATNEIELAEGESGSTFVLEPNSNGEILITADIKHEYMNEWFVSHINNGEKSTYNVAIITGIQLPFEITGEYAYPIPTEELEGVDKIMVEVEGNRVVIIIVTSGEFKTNIFPMTVKL